MKNKKLLLIAILLIIATTVSYAVLAPSAKVIMKTTVHKIGTAPKSISENPEISKFILEFSRNERNYFNKLDSNINEIEQLRSLGFVNTAKDHKYTREDIKYIKFLYKAYDQIYPNNQFITHDCLNNILEEFKLINRNFEDYIGDIPKKNIQEIMDFEICALDRRLMRIHHYKWNFAKHISCATVKINDSECKNRLNLTDYKLWFPLNYKLDTLCADIKEINYSGLYYEINNSNLKYDENYIEGNNEQDLIDKIKSIDYKKYNYSTMTRGTEYKSTGSKRDENYSGWQSWYNDININSTHKFTIIAPPQKFLKEETVSKIQDPIILAPVYGGYIIVSCW